MWCNLFITDAVNDERECNELRSHRIVQVVFNESGIYVLTEGRLGWLQLAWIVWWRILWCHVPCCVRYIDSEIVFFVLTPYICKSSKLLTRIHFQCRSLCHRLITFHKICILLSRARQFPSRPREGTLRSLLVKFWVLLIVVCEKM